MKHTELKAFVRKYNSEFAIKGYSKMKKQQLTDTVIARLSKSRKEIKKEWHLCTLARSPSPRSPPKNELSQLTPRNRISKKQHSIRQTMPTTSSTTLGQLVIRVAS